MVTLTLVGRVVELANTTALLVDKVNNISINKSSPQHTKYEILIDNGSRNPEVLNNWILHLNIRFDYNLIHEDENVSFTRLKLIGLAKLGCRTCNKSKSYHHLNWACGIPWPHALSFYLQT
jgi:hypothetical protein